jgi:hypothetical protein
MLSEKFLFLAGTLVIYGLWIFVLNKLLDKDNVSVPARKKPRPNKPRRSVGRY